MKDFIKDDADQGSRMTSLAMIRRMIAKEEKAIMRMLKKKMRRKKNKERKKEKKIEKAKKEAEKDKKKKEVHRVMLAASSTKFKNKCNEKESNLAYDILMSTITIAWWT